MNSTAKVETFFEFPKFFCNKFIFLLLQMPDDPVFHLSEAAL